MRSLIFILLAAILGSSSSFAKTAQRGSDWKADVFYLRGPKDKQFIMRSNYATKKAEQFQSTMYIGQSSQVAASVEEDDDNEPPLLLDSVEE